LNTPGGEDLSWGITAEIRRKDADASMTRESRRRTRGGDETAYGVGHRDARGRYGVGEELMGHAAIEMTLRSAHLTPKVRRDAVEVLDRPPPANGDGLETGGRSIRNARE
jgi:hypothetical protein